MPQLMLTLGEAEITPSHLWSCWRRKKHFILCHYYLHQDSYLVINIYSLKKLSIVLISNFWYFLLLGIQLRNCRIIH